ncbi:MAG TPA: hypothetical protein VIG49_06185 [Acetobacteraceae bacterium]
MDTAAQPCADQVIRDQFGLFHGLSRIMRLEPAQQRWLLRLTPEQWNGWLQFSQDGTRPAEPPVPVLLMRIGSAAHRLAAAE